MHSGAAHETNYESHEDATDYGQGDAVQKSSAPVMSDSTQMQHSVCCNSTIQSFKTFPDLHVCTYVYMRIPHDFTIILKCMLEVA